jgi:hypothetical protein
MAVILLLATNKEGAKGNIRRFLLGLTFGDVVVSGQRLPPGNRSAIRIPVAAVAGCIFVFYSLF